LKFYRKVLAISLLGDLMPFWTRIKKFLLFFGLLGIVIFFKYLLLIGLIVFFIYFFCFYLVARLKTNFWIYLQRCFNLFLIILGGIFVYSWEFIRYFILIFLYISLSLIFRLKYILFIILVLYLGVTTNFFYFLICRGLEDWSDMLEGLTDRWIAMGFPLRQWWVPCFESLPIPEVLYDPSPWVPRTARILTPILLAPNSYGRF
jgi:hypothetical protein